MKLTFPPLAMLIAGLGLLLASSGGGLPIPIVDPEPQPAPGPRQVVIIEESGDRSPQRAALLQRARQTFERCWIEDYDTPSEKFQAYVDATERSELPKVFVTDSLGMVLHAGPLPDDWESLVALAREHSDD